MAACSRCGASLSGEAPRTTTPGPARGPGWTLLFGQGRGWCADCDALYDQFLRGHATDIVWQALVGGVVIATIGVGLPLLGVGSLIAATGAFAGFGTLFGLARWNRRRRRQQFLQGALPRAYLPAPK